MNYNEVVGLIPCAGNATRLGALPFSKELFPIGFDVSDGEQNVKVVSSYLIDHMKDAGVKDFHLIIKEGKWDIPTYFNNNKPLNANLCYHLANVDYGVPFSLNTAYPFVKDKIVCLGFPDILFKPKKVYNQLLKKLTSNSSTSIVLGVMPINRPEKWDMIEYDSNNKINKIVIKSTTESGLKYGWFCAVWSPKFSEYLNSYILSLYKEKSPKELKNSEIYIGDVVRAAMKIGFSVESVIFEEGICLDIGTPEDLVLSNTFLNETTLLS